MDTRDLVLLIESEQDKFASADTLADFAALIGGPRGDVLAKYADGWAGRYYETCKAHPGTYLHRPLTMPRARALTDIFTAADLAEYVVTTHRGSRLACPPGYVFVGSSMAPSAVPTLYAGGTRGVSLWPDGTCVRNRSGARFLMSCALPSPATLDTLNGSPCSFQIVGRADGLLVIARDRGGIFSSWVALLDSGQSLESLMPPPTRALLQAEREADAAAWACIKRGADGRDYLDENAARAAGVPVTLRR